MIRKFSTVAPLALLVFMGCASIGPSNLTRDRLDYMTALSDSWKRMMLLNIVKLRYGDSPIFLEVASVISQYALETEISASASWNAFLPEDSQTIGGRGRYSDRPTVTYNPILGQKFTESLLKPIPVTSLAALLQTGYSAEFLFRVCVTAINGIYNQSRQGLMMRDEDPEFEQLIDTITRIQQAGGLGMRVVKLEKDDASIMYFRRDMSEELVADVAEMKRLLKLDPESRDYGLVYGAMAADDKEIAILTRSMLQITAEVAARVEVPPLHVEENRALPGVYDEPELEEEERRTVKIRSSEDKPEDAFVSVRYRDHWFYIDDRDLSSKRMFSFIIFVFTLVESAPVQKGPDLTLPTG